jgi:hypothetical protein
VKFFRAHVRAHVRTFGLILLCVSLLGCNKDSAIANDDSATLVKVNGEPITHAQFEIVAQTLLGGQPVRTLPEAARKKLLEGMVASKALSQKALQSLDQKTLLDIEYKVANRREQLLLNEYLKLKAKQNTKSNAKPSANSDATNPSSNSDSKPSALSESLVAEYYESHLAEFGGGSDRRYQTIMSEKNVSGDMRNTLIESLGQAKAEDDWQAYSNTLVLQNLPVTFRSGVLNSQALDKSLLGKKLSAAISTTPVGSSSAVVFANGKTFVVKVLAETKKTPQALNDVRGEIHKRLAPVLLKNAIESVKEQVMSEAKVEYL